MSMTIIGASWAYYIHKLNIFPSVNDPIGLALHVRVEKVEKESLKLYLQTSDECSCAKIPGLEQKTPAGANESMAIGSDGKHGDDLCVALEPPNLLSSLDLNNVNVLANSCDKELLILRYADLASSVDRLDRLGRFEATRMIVIKRRSLGSPAN